MLYLRRTWLAHIYKAVSPSNTEYPQGAFLSRFPQNMLIRGGRDNPVAKNLLSRSRQNMTAQEIVWVRGFEIKWFI